MPSALQLGPFAWPIQLVIIACAVGVLLLVGSWAAGSSSAVVSRLLWRTVLVAMVFSRLAFVWQFRHAYLEAPLDILDVRDGGWSPEGGLVAGWFYALAVTRGVRSAARKSVVLAMLAASATWTVGALLVAVAPGTRAPLSDIAIANADGSTFSLAMFKGRPTVVNLWATWCPPCQHEMPLLRSAQKDRPDVNFIFVNQGEDQAVVDAFLKVRRLPLANVFLDQTGAVGTQLGQRALPTTLFFDAAGTLVTTRLGELSKATLEQNLSLLSAGQPK